MNIKHDVSLKDLNTFKVDVTANTVITIENEIDFSNKEIFYQEKPHMVLGGGSNILFTDNYNGVIFLIKNKGINIEFENDDFLIVKICAGEVWNDIVDWSVKKNLLGLHNLALIPGSTGATPIQNVGAYGVEIKDFLTEVEVLNLQTKNLDTLSNNECKFRYRDSIFKNELKDKVIVKSIKLKLHKYKGYIDDRYIEYSGVKEELEGKKLTPNMIYKAIVKIRNSKLPSIDEYGSCGSTFKNPEIEIYKYKKLLKEYPELPMYETQKEGVVKIPAAYILEKLGWKNKRKGKVGTWIYHPLIVTNYGNANSKEIYSYIKDIQLDFKYNTGIDLECEINII